MEKPLIIYLLLVLNLAQSQELITYTLLPPESREHSDLNFLEEELRGKRLVMLGEMTHLYVGPLSVDYQSSEALMI
jgi:hypothetical protein